MPVWVPSLEAWLPLEAVPRRRVPAVSGPRQTFDLRLLELRMPSFEIVRGLGLGTATVFS